MPFPMEQQHETNWCWDAVSVSLEHYFNPESTLTQEQFGWRARRPLAEADQPDYWSNPLTHLRVLNRAPLDALPELRRIEASSLRTCRYASRSRGTREGFTIW